MAHRAEVVETAVRKLAVGVNKVIDRLERQRRKDGVFIDLAKLQPRAKRLLANIRHLFLSLRQNQHSLTLGIQCLDNMMGNNNSNNTMDVRLAFATLLRLHDGYILTVSGECRHAGDRNAARNSPFPSKLHENEAVYTKNNVYSGTAWDEWNDDKCGLRTKLCRLLHNVDYDALVEPGEPAAVFEDMVSQTEQTLIGMQSDFQRLKSKMERVFSAKIIWRDRMEKLSADRVHLERVGSQFQVSMALGVSTMEDWELLMKPKKKKRIIADAGDEEDDLVVTKQCTALREDHGLQVKVTEPKQKDESLAVEISVNEIKQTMGVNVQQLEAARMEVEGEEERARKEADEIDDAEPEIRPEEAKCRVKRARKAYERALLHNDDDTLIWNARERLREELMRAGDVMLDTTDDHQALSYFESAAALVRSQQLLDKKLGNDIYFGMNLLMLLCRAEINIVIACIQIATRRPPRREQCLQRACQEADAAVTHSQEMMQASEDVADQLRAAQLYSLAMRNKGVALWHLRKREEAKEAFNAAGMSPQISAKSTEDDPIWMECHIERYNAWTILADLAINILERADMKAMKENETFYCDMFQTVKAAMLGARSASTDIQRFTDDHDSLSTDVTSPNKLTESLSELESWWNERKNTALALGIDTQKRKDTRRGDLSLPVSKVPPRRFVIGGNVSSTRQHVSTQTRSNGQRQYKKSSRPPPRQQATPAIRRYRKWREDMIMDSSTGKWVPKLEYPAVAPPMPPEIAAILAARRAQVYQ